VRTISSDLTAAQQAASSVPYVECLVNDYWGDRTRLRFSRYYTGAETEGYVAAVIASDGSLVRARLEDNGATSTLYVSRVATPGSGSTYSSWTSLESGVSDQAACALARHGTTLLLFYCASDDKAIRLRTSADNGATWSSASTILTATGAVKYMAAAVNQTSGDRLLVWSEGATVYRSRYSSGSWGSRTAWTQTVGAITGLAAMHYQDFQVLVAGLEATTFNPKLYAVRFGDGFNGVANVWSSLGDVAAASVDGDVSYAAPACCRVDGVWRAWFVEKFIGDLAYKRLHATDMEGVILDFGSGDFWREPVAMDYAGTDFGVAAAPDGDAGVWLVSANGVWYSASPALPELELTADVIEASVVADAKGAGAVVVLNNEGGAYTLYGAGDLAVLQRGARLQLSPGYKGAGGDEVADEKGAYWITEIEQITGEEPRLIIRARDATWLLSTWRSRQQYVWASGAHTVGNLAWRVCSRAGLDVNIGSPTSDLMTNLLPAFTVHPGGDGRDGGAAAAGDGAGRRLLAGRAAGDLRDGVDGVGVLRLRCGPRDRERPVSGAGPGGKPGAGSGPGRLRRSA
jgi:hypothetical protein